MNILNESNFITNGANPQTTKAHAVKPKQKQPMPPKLMEYRVGVDVTYSVWVTVKATSEEKAETLAKDEAGDNPQHGSWVKSEIHFIDEVGEVEL